MAFAKIGPKYQITIPKEARETIGLNVGDLVEATVSDDVLILRPKAVVDRRAVKNYTAGYLSKRKGK